MLIMGVTEMTIEEIQIMSKVFLGLAGMLAVLAVIFFVCFDIRNIWGLIVQHKSKVVKSVQIEERRETIPLETKSLEETVLLENTNGTLKVFQDEIYIHTDIRIT